MHKIAILYLAAFLVIAVAKADPDFPECYPCDTKVQVVTNQSFSGPTIPPIDDDETGGTKNHISHAGLR